jgi:predicted SAM-dependent methyltransferase
MIYLERWAKRIFAPRTLYLIRFDLARWQTRRSLNKQSVSTPLPDHLHLGSGVRPVAGWLNVDIAESDQDVDIAAGRLPWPDEAFRLIVSQHVIEHLELMTELIPLLRELRRVLQVAGELWLSCPDMAKVCRLYVDGRLPQLLNHRQARWPEYRLVYTALEKMEAIHAAEDIALDTLPLSHLVNDFFHQWGDHKNLFDFPLLAWTLQQAGFQRIERQTEADFLARFPDFPPREDDFQSLYICARQR